MNDTQAVTIYTTHPRYGNIVRYQGELQDHGCQPRQGPPLAAYVRFVPRGKMSPREILLAADPYILITTGYEGILTPDMFVVTATLTAAQKSWVQAHGAIRLGFDARFSPIAFTNVAGGFDGLAAEVKLPTPACAKCSVPGLLLASAISSFTELAGTEGCTVNTLGPLPSEATSVSCFLVS